jgi:hypothetical protein
MSVSSLVAVNIDFWGYFLRISLFETNGLQYTTENMSGKISVQFHKPVLLFQLTVDPSASDKQNSLCMKGNTPAGTTMQLQFVDLYKSGLWRGLGGGRCPFWIQTETLTFKGPAS